MHGIKEKLSKKGFDLGNAKVGGERKIVFKGGKTWSYSMKRAERT